MPKEERNGKYRFHHFLISILCVFGLVCIVTSLYSISNAISNSRLPHRDMKRRNLVDNADVVDDMRHNSEKDNIFRSESSDFSSFPKSNEDSKYAALSDLPNIESNKRKNIRTVSGVFDMLNSSKLTGRGNKSTKSGSREKETPALVENYHATGLLILPHSGIAEPFEIWYAPRVRKSRIDYYYGTDKTFQRGDRGEHGVAYKYVPMYNDRQGSFDGCWTVTGNERRPIVPQIITPNITWFQYNNTEVYTGALTTKWTYQYSAYGMKNSQKFWMTKTKPYRPIRYEMNGYDMMLGSYYDHYVIEYISFEEWDGDQEIFELPGGIQCYNWTNSLSDSLRVNPMQEFTAFTPQLAVDAEQRYQEYKEMHLKDDPKDTGEALKRKHIFKHNVRYVQSHNRKNLSFKLKETKFLDMLNDEMNVLHGSLEKDNKHHKGVRNLTKVEEDGVDDSLPPPLVEIPRELDWREYGAVTPVKGQGICGSCYALTAAGAAEGAWYRKTGNLVPVSTQQLIDCSWGYGNHGCKGGHYAAALSWIFVHGISTQKSYGKYLGQEGYCHFNDTLFGAKIDGFSYIQPWNKTALKRAVAKYGPVAVSVNSSPLSFKFYSHGVYSDPACSPNRTGHSALVIGYGNQQGQDYWLVKNSWSSSWGENGYIKISMDNHLCGITEYPVAVIMNQLQFHLGSKTKIIKDDGTAHKVHGKKRPQNNFLEDGQSTWRNFTKNNFKNKTTLQKKKSNKNLSIEELEDLELKEIDQGRQELLQQIKNIKSTTAVPSLEEQRKSKNKKSKKSKTTHDSKFNYSSKKKSSDQKNNYKNSEENKKKPRGVDGVSSNQLSITAEKPQVKKDTETITKIHVDTSNKNGLIKDIQKDNEDEQESGNTQNIKEDIEDVDSNVEKPNVAEQPIVADDNEDQNKSLSDDNKNSKKQKKIAIGNSNNNYITTENSQLAESIANDTKEGKESKVVISNELRIVKEKSQHTDSKKNYGEGSNSQQHTSGLPLIGLHIMDADKDNETEFENQISESVENVKPVQDKVAEQDKEELKKLKNKKKKKPKRFPKNKAEDRNVLNTTLLNKAESTESTDIQTSTASMPHLLHIPLLEVAKDMFHRALENTKHKQVKQNKLKARDEQKRLRHTLNKFGEDALSEIGVDKPTLNPEKIGMYDEDSETTSHQPERPTIMGTKKNKIEHHRSTDKIDRIFYHLSKPLMLIEDSFYKLKNYQNNSIVSTNPTTSYHSVFKATRKNNIMFGKQLENSPLLTHVISLKNNSSNAEDSKLFSQPFANDDTDEAENEADITTPIALNNLIKENKKKYKGNTKIKSNEEEEEIKALTFLNKLEGKIGVKEKYKTQKYIQKDVKKDVQKDVQTITKPKKQKLTKLKKDIKLTNFEKAAQNSMAELYSRIDKAMAYAQKQKENSNKTRISKPTKKTQKQLITEKLQQAQKTLKHANEIVSKIYTNNGVNKNNRQYYEMNLSPLVAKQQQTRGENVNQYAATPLNAHSYQKVFNNYGTHENTNKQQENANNMYSNRTQQ